MTKQPRVNGRISVVIPAFAQEKTIRDDLVRIQARIEQISDDFEIIVVVDGVVDRTAELARGVAGPHTRIEILPENRGKGYAVRRGVNLTRGDVVGFIDAGGDIDPAAIETTARLVDEDLADIAVGSKRHPESDVKYPIRRRIFSWGYQILCRALFGLDVRDTQVGIKFMSRAAADAVFPQVHTDGFAFDIELLALAHRRGFVRLEECPVRVDLAFPSAIGAGSVFQMLFDTLRIYVRMRLFRQYGPSRV